MSKTPFAAALASTLIPGGKLPNCVEAPAAGELIDAVDLSDWVTQPDGQAAVKAILTEAGDADAFIAASPEQRTAALRVTEAERPSSFQSLVTNLLTLYYEHPTVLEAFGWRSAPPQPQGHELAACDEALFERVVARGPTWRKTD